MNRLALTFFLILISINALACSCWTEFAYENNNYWTNAEAVVVAKVEGGYEYGDKIPDGETEVLTTFVIREVLSGPYSIGERVDIAQRRGNCMESPLRANVYLIRVSGVEEKPQASRCTMTLVDIEPPQIEAEDSGFVKLRNGVVSRGEEKLKKVRIEILNKALQPAAKSGG